MTEQNWSKEPWRSNTFGAVVTDDDDMTFLVRGADDPFYEGNLIAESLGKENARRIVACVNACAGIPTEALEAGQLKEILDAVTKMIREYPDTPMPRPMIDLELLMHKFGFNYNIFQEWAQKSPEGLFRGETNA